MTERERERVAAAARRLGNLPRRERRWAHLPLCVVDAVFSIGARYTATSRTVWAYAGLVGLQHVLEPADEVAPGRFAETEQPVSGLAAFVDALGSEELAHRIRNRQRTSSRGGVLKAEAVRRYAATLAGHGVERLADVPPLLGDPDRLTAVEARLARVPGHGQHGIRVSYLWMLAGDEQHVKPDRMVTRWLSGVLERPVHVFEATALVTTVAADVGVTPWQLDHAIWNSARRTGRGS